jgi:hypothetical protein
VGYTLVRNQYRFWIPSLGRVIVSHNFRPRVVTSTPQQGNTVDAQHTEPRAQSSGTPPPFHSPPLTTMQLHARYRSLFYSGPTEPSFLKSSLSPPIPHLSPDLPSAMRGAFPDSSSVLSSAPTYPAPWPADSTGDKAESNHPRSTRHHRPHAMRSSSPRPPACGAANHHSSGEGS